MPLPLAPNALTTLDDVKNLLGMDSSDVDEQRDTVLTMLINGVSSWIERLIGRKLGKDTYVHQLDAQGRQELILLQWPILSVDYARDTSENKVIPPDSYSFNMQGDIGILYRDKGWPFRAYRSGLAYDVHNIKRVIEVKYTAGYVLPKDATEEEPATLPCDLQMVVWGAIMQEFALMQNGAQGLKAFSISDVSWTFDKEPRQEWLTTIGLYARL